MATIQSRFFRGNAQIPFNSPKLAGSVVTVIATIDLSAGLLAADVMELVPFHPNCRITEFDITDVGTLIGTTNITIGVMTGNPGDLTTVRTVGNELIDAQAAGTPRSTTLQQLAALARNGDATRSLGLRVSANVTAGAGKALTIRYSYIA